jgi:hypothetical protein
MYPMMRCFGANLTACEPIPTELGIARLLTGGRRTAKPPTGGALGGKAIPM